MDFYKKSPINNPYSQTKIVMGEPDLRKEIKRILYDESRGSYLIYRRVRRDAQGNPIIADSSLSNRSVEATYGTNKGMKYLFDDHMIVGYISEGSTFHDTGIVKEYGDSRTDKNTLFLEYDVLLKISNNHNDMPDEFDKILVPHVDLDGNISSPLKCSLKYDIGSCEPYRLDKSGRVEFFKINLVSNMDDSVRLWQ